MIHTVSGKNYFEKKSKHFFSNTMSKVPAVDALQFILSLIPFTLM